jgi:hypothetical protein
LKVLYCWGVVIVSASEGDQAQVSPKSTVGVLFSVKQGSTSPAVTSLLSGTSGFHFGSRPAPDSHAMPVTNNATKLCSALIPHTTKTSTAHGKDQDPYFMGYLLLSGFIAQYHCNQP